MRARDGQAPYEEGARRGRHADAGLGRVRFDGRGVAAAAGVVEFSAGREAAVERSSALVERLILCALARASELRAV